MTTNQTKKRFRFIPFRKHDLVDMCLENGDLAQQDNTFRAFCQMLESVYHFEFHKIIESLKTCYAPFDPDTDTRAYRSTENIKTSPFVNQLENLLEKANFERISQQDLNQALTESSMFKIRLEVDFEEFSEVLLFCRGEHQREEIFYRLWRWFPYTINFTNYERVVIFIRFKDKPLAETSSLHQSGATLLKLFQNVPKADLEMLFPNTQVRMRLQDKLLIGVPAIVSGFVVLTTKLSASLVLFGSLLAFWLGFSQQPVEINKTTLLILLAGAGALGGYIWKQFNNFKNRKLRFMQSLTQNLYFKNLDNNAGVFYRLVNDAEEEESKEALLAYYFLLTSKQPLSRELLDQSIEHWFREQWQCQLDFEIDDAIKKLLSLNLLTETNGILRAVELNSALKILDKRWDNYFNFE